MSKRKPIWRPTRMRVMIKIYPKRINYEDVKIKPNGGLVTIVHVQDEALQWLGDCHLLQEHCTAEVYSARHIRTYIPFLILCKEPKTIRYVSDIVVFQFSEIFCKCL
jgi:hypothetical protein